MSMKRPSGDEEGDMSRKMVAIVGGVSGAAAAAWAAPAEAMIVMGSAVVAASCWFGSRCHHSGPLGLLPPVIDRDGSRIGSRWFCDACGRSWPAGLERATAPVVKYAGFVQSKAPLAARRAANLAKKTQEMAVRRAGLTSTRAVTLRVAAAPAPSTIVSIQQWRRAAMK
jgi:hypothetical protein